MRHCVKVHSANGSFVVKYVKQRAIKDMLDNGEIVLHERTNQYRVLPLDFLHTSSPPSSAAICSREMENYVGLHGPKHQAIAKEKVDAYQTV